MKKQTTTGNWTFQTWPTEKSGLKISYTEQRQIKKNIKCLENGKSRHYSYIKAGTRMHIFTCHSFFFFIRFFYLSFLYIFLIYSGTESNGGRIYCDNIVLMKNQVSNPGSWQTLSNECWHGGYFQHRLLAQLHANFLLISLLT